MENKIPSKEELKKRLTPEQFEVCLLKGTERPFSGQHWDNHAPGLYRCVICSADLFSSNSKFDSKTGWPSFFQPAHPKAVDYERDLAHGMVRTEVVCARCRAHLGHVFDDGPPPSGKRYCINSAALVFIPSPDRADED